MLDYLNAREDVTVYSERSPDKALRIPVISFSVHGKSSKKIVEAVDGMSDLGIRWGHFYSKRLVDEVLGLGDEGVVRVSMVHYNTGMSPSCYPISYFIIRVVYHTHPPIKKKDKNK